MPFETDRKYSRIEKYRKNYGFAVIKGPRTRRDGKILSASKAGALRNPPPLSHKGIELKIADRCARDQVLKAILCGSIHTSFLCTQERILLSPVYPEK